MVDAGGPYRVATGILRCPRCGEIMLHEHPVHRCPGCRGAFVREAVLDRALDAERTPPLQWIWWRDASLKCPACNDGMRTTMMAGLHLDRCPAHGIWFDLGELEALLRGAGRGDVTADDIVERLRQHIASEP